MGIGETGVEQMGVGQAGPNHISNNYLICIYDNVIPALWLSALVRW